jgi:hypothetical protein
MLKVANFTMPKKECARKNRKKPLCRPTLIKYLLIDNCATTTEMLTFFHTSIFFGGRYTVHVQYPTAAIFSFTSKEKLICILLNISIIWCDLSHYSDILIYDDRKAFLNPNICILWCEIFHCIYIPLYDDRKDFILPNICILWCEIFRCRYIYEDDDRKAFILPKICILWCEISHYSSIPM